MSEISAIGASWISSGRNWLTNMFINRYNKLTENVVMAKTSDYFK